MQTSEKITRPFIFKLLILFALLLSGAMLKAPKADKGSTFNHSRNINDAASLQDTDLPSAQITVVY
ncbi:hypothetical protein [Pontibacter beigongshangensis]|uniref:hypothetical protein n=1 Tax=Pontibacter beigongshangensis TaxID=2574733 RepID=UPI00164F8AD2|nr:hypothetical protein [Pontibacter beigongshangensis]